MKYPNRVFFKVREEKKNARIHYQGKFELKGSRTGKKQLLKMFGVLGCTKNLTFRPELSVDSTDYCTKAETRVSGPLYVGSSSYRRKNRAKKMASTALKRVKRSLS